MKSPSPVRRPKTAGTGIGKSPALSLKPKSTAAAHAGQQCELDGDLSQDPIAICLKIRLDIGGLGSNASDADAKKHGYPRSKYNKHPALKGAALVDLAGPSKPELFQSPKKAERPPTSASSGIKGLRAPTKVSSSALRMSATKNKAESGAVEIGPAISTNEDPIGASL